MAKPQLGKWQLLHTYNNLVDEGVASELKCADDRSVLIPILDTSPGAPTDDPILWCPVCDRTMNPGIDFWDQIGAAVRDNVDL